MKNKSVVILVLVVAVIAIGYYMMRSNTQSSDQAGAVNKATTSSTAPQSTDLTDSKKYPANDTPASKAAMAIYAAKYTDTKSLSVALNAAGLGGTGSTDVIIEYTGCSNGLIYHLLSNGTWVYMGGDGQWHYSAFNGTGLTPSCMYNSAE